MLSPSSLLDFDRRLHAVVAFSRLPESQALAAANKRIGNILRQAGVNVSGEIDTALLDSDAERELVAAVAQAESDSAPLINDADYIGLLQRIARLRDPVDRYFDNVMVMAEDESVRRNRLILLGRLRGLFLRVADISMLPSAHGPS